MTALAANPTACGDVMIRVSLPYIYELAANLKPLNYVAYDTPFKESRVDLFNAETYLDGFLHRSVYAPHIKTSLASGVHLLAMIRNVTSAQSDEDRLITFLDKFYIQSALQQFETVLTAELNVSHSYFVIAKRGYDSTVLIDRAEIVFAPDLTSKAPEALEDVRQAGKCIAFELPTAAGFHLMRALEMIIRLYYDSVMPQGSKRPDRMNMGDYISKMEQAKIGDCKVLGVLKQVKDLHRNELMHPEVSLDMDEALGLLGIVQSAITAMLRVLPEKQLQLTGD